MKIVITYLSILFLSIASANAQTVPTRSYATKAAFAKQTACPATSKHVVSCAGYVIDHKIPLCAGGKDAVENMQWQLKSESYKKDTAERAYCSCLKTNKTTCTFKWPIK